MIGITMDNETTIESTDFNLGKEIVKSFASSAAISAGVTVGFVAVSLAVVKIKSLKEARKAKKETKN